MTDTYHQLSFGLAWRMYVSHARHLILIMAAPALALLSSTACEAMLLRYPPQAGGGLLLVYAISAVRLLAFGMGLGSATWFCAAVLIEDLPSAREAVQAGWGAAWRAAFSALPIWALALLYALLVAAGCRTALELFRVTGPLLQTLALLFILLCAAPPLVLLAAKYAFIIPVLMLSRPRPVSASARASMLLPWRGVWAVSPYLFPAALLTGGFVFVPSLTFVNSLWAMLGAAHTTLHAVCARQAAGAVLFMLGAPLAVCANTLLYCAFYAPWRLPASENAPAASPEPSSTL